MSPKDVATLVALMEKLVSEQVDAKLAVMGVAQEFTSKRLPPGVSRRTFVEVCRKIPGARREGRIWIVSVASWRAARVATPPKAPLLPANDDAAALLEAAGLRPTRPTSRGRES